MKRKIQIILSTSAASVLAFSALAQDTSNPKTIGTNNACVCATHAAKASKLIGETVRNNRGEKLGKVQDLAVNVESGRIVQVVLSTGGFFGIGSTLRAVPPEALSCDAGHKFLRLDADKEKLASAPIFEKSKWTECCDADHLNAVYRYYDIAPYSTANTSPAADNTARNVKPYFATDASTEASNAPIDANNTVRNVRDRDGRALTPLNQGASHADIDTTAQIRKGIIATKDMSTDAKNVKIITIDGHVTLRGPVSSAGEKSIIGEIATRIVGAGNVDNQLEVKLTASND